MQEKSPTPQELTQEKHELLGKYQLLKEELMASESCFEDEVITKKIEVLKAQIKSLSKEIKAFA